LFIHIVLFLSKTTGMPAFSFLFVPALPEKNEIRCRIPASAGFIFAETAPVIPPDVAVVIF